MTNDEGMTKPEIAHEVDGSVAADDDPTFVRAERDTTWVYHLEERTGRFGGAMIDLAKTILPDEAPIISLVGSGTSIRANYVEADDAVSKKEFGASWPAPDLFKDLEEEKNEKETNSGSYSRRVC